MANLAEGAAAAIGADALLTRVGAYYHDLGKTIQPKYFVENLSPGEPSPHNELEPRCQCGRDHGARRRGRAHSSRRWHS